MIFPFYSWVVHGFPESDPQLRAARTSTASLSCIPREEKTLQKWGFLEISFISCCLKRQKIGIKALLGHTRLDVGKPGCKIVSLVGLALVFRRF